MPLFNSDRTRKERELKREVCFKQGTGRVRRYVEKGEASGQYSHPRSNRWPSW